MELYICTFYFSTFFLIVRELKYGLAYAKPYSITQNRI